jgi:hypothetical protein
MPMLSGESRVIGDWLGVEASFHRTDYNTVTLVTLAEPGG